MVFLQFLVIILIVDDGHTTFSTARRWSWASRCTWDVGACADGWDGRDVLVVTVITTGNIGVQRTREDVEVYLGIEEAGSGQRRTA